MPTQLTSTSRPPNAAAALRTAALVSASEVASPCVIGQPGSSAASRPAFASSSASAATFAPSARNASSTARPIPEPAPVTSARLPSSQPISFHPRARLAAGRRTRGPARSGPPAQEGTAGSDGPRPERKRAAARRCGCAQALRPGDDAASPPRKCQRYSLLCSYVSLPAAPFAYPGSRAARSLRTRPVRVELGGRTAPALAPGPGERAELPGAVPATHPGPHRVRMAGRRFRDGAAAGTAGLLPGNGGVLRPGEASRAAIVAQGRTGRRVPDRGARHAVGGAPRVSQSGPGAGAEGGVGAVPLVSAGACGGGVLPSYNGPRRALACRIRRYPRADSSTG